MDYNESVVEGKEWQRANRVVIENEYNGTPSIMFVEEVVVQLADRTVKTPCGTLVEQFDPLKEFPIRAADGSLTGETMSYGMVYVLLNSLYRNLTDARDTQ